MKGPNAKVRSLISSFVMRGPLSTAKDSSSVRNSIRKGPSPPSAITTRTSRKFAAHMEPRQYQIPFSPNRYSVATATQTDKSCGMIMPMPFAMVTASAPDATQMTEEKRKGIR